MPIGYTTTPHYPLALPVVLVVSWLSYWMRSIK
jgi:hypothetical protein